MFYHQPKTQLETFMDTVIAEVKTLLDRLPEDSNYEDIQYHLYVLEKIKRGRDRVKSEGSLSQIEVEEKLKHWL